MQSAVEGRLMSKDEAGISLAITIQANLLYQQQCVLIRFMLSSAGVGEGETVVWWRDLRQRAVPITLVRVVGRRAAKSTRFFGVAWHPVARAREIW